MSEKKFGFEKYLSDSKWVDVVGFDFENEDERDNFFYKNRLAEKDDYVEMRLNDRGILNSINNKRFKGVILIDGQNPDKAKATGFIFDATKRNFTNSENIEITAKDLQMLISSIGGDFGLWCVFSPRQAGNYEVIVSPDDKILKSRGKVI